MKLPAQTAPGSVATGCARSIVDVLRRLALSEPSSTVFTWLPERGAAARTLTFAELDARARAIASRLVEGGLRGERALLLFPAGLDFVEAFFACLYAGVIAVPAFPPRNNRTLDRLEAIASDAAATTALSPAGILPRSREIAAAHPALGRLTFIATDDIASPAATAFDEISIEPRSLAYLQYTSGSSSEPKGVMISHANVVANSEDIRRGFGHTSGSRSLCWLPHFHDMGLIDGIIQPVYSGFSAFLISPAQFLQAPASWLEAISEHGITHSGGPNFAYDLCARRAEPDPAKLDLRSWAVAYNGAEPVRTETLDRFASRFAPCGFRREAFYPAYGLAEATLKVSGGMRGKGPTIVRLDRTALEAGRAEEGDAGTALVGAGRTAGSTRAVIVDAGVGHALPENEVGEIWVSGPGVALGYFRKSEETERTFGARIAGDNARYLRTGDLGFLRGGEIFVTGRVKDLIIVRGRNVYPQDVELTAASCHSALRPGGGAAFGVEASGEERLVLVHEIDRHGAGDLDGILDSLRAAIVEAHEIDPYAIVLVGPSAVPRTTSGKVQRGACRKLFLDGSLDAVAEWRAPLPGEAADDGGLDAATGDARAWIASRLALKLGVPAGSIAFDLPLARLGLDSLRSLELAHEIEVRFGAATSAADLLDAASLSEIVARLERAAIPAADRGDAGAGAPEECDLSAGQRAIWFLQQLAPSSTAYTIASALRLQGPLDEAAFERAARSVIARHASLRARIVGGGAGPRQRFDVAFEAIYSRGDLAGVADRDLAVRLADVAHEPFDLERGPLFRITLLRAGAARILLISAHHVIADLWSLSVLLRDLRERYAAEIGRGRMSGLPAPHPADFVRVHADLIASDAGERQIEFWRERLSGDLPALDLPADRPRPPAQSFLGGARAFRIDPALSRALRDLARSRSVTLYTLLLAAYQALLVRITGQRELLVGAPASGRTDPRFAGLVAYLVNAVVLRADLSDDPTFDDLVRATHDRVVAALRNQDYPFATLVKRLTPERDPRRSPFFDTMFDLHAAGEIMRGDLAAAGGAARAEFADGIVAEPIEVERRAAQFDLSVTVTDDGDGLSMELEYNSDLFDAATIDGLARRFDTLLHGVVADPSTRVSRLALLDPAGRAAALREANARPVPAPAECVHRLFERQASRAPEAVAAWHGEARLTYGALNRRANILARRLRAVGIGPESRVAVCLDKSFDLLVALIAVLKAGGAYVPIDPSLPASRRRFMAADSGARVLLSRDDLAGDFDPGLTRLVEEGQELRASGVPGEEGTNLADGPGTGNLAYLIYTSGTTGTPKGVGVTHANLHGAYRAWEGAYGLSSLTTHLQMASPGFDVFTGDMVRALGSGGALVLCNRDTLLDPPALAALARARGVEFAEFVPATLRELASHLAREGERLDTLRLVVVGSDVWSMADYALFRDAFGARTRLVNSYGVTEATIDSTLDDVEEGPARRTVPAIGRPLANTSAYLLDGDLEPLPDGIRGELYLGGPAVARGYVGRPDLTADRFIPDPHGGPGARMYRTGDAARRLADGRIEFAGRADDQVKIRGYRIEPAEIEAALRAHARVRAAAVVARDREGRRLLVAYVAFDGDRAGAASELRAHLAGRLPDYMVPSIFVLLDAMPLSPNGKVDRRALPEPDWGAGTGAADSRPMSGHERSLAEIWRRVLGVPRVGPFDNFFELGGDSILSIQVVARAREAGLRVLPRMIFEHPTVAALARAARPGGSGAGADSPAIAWSGEAPLLPMQRWFLHQAFEDPDHWNMAMALDARGPIDPERARRAARALLDHHDALRARFPREGSGWRQVIDPPGGDLPNLSVIDVAAGASREEAVAGISARLNGGLDLERGPVIRLGIVTGGSSIGATLVVVAHHLVVDGVSLRLIVEDLDRACRRTLSGEAIDLPARTSPCGAFASTLEEQVRAGRFDGDVDHWRRLASAQIPVTPLDRPAVAPIEATTATTTIDLDERRTADLLRKAAAAGERVEDVLLAALASACAPWSGARSFYVELEGHGRDPLPAHDLSRTVGWFTETHPVLIEGIDPADLPATLRAVARATRTSPGGSYLALRWLSPDPAIRETMARLPAPQVSFNYLGRFDAALDEGSFFERLREPSSAQRSPRARRTHALEIDASVVASRLSVRWSWSREQLEGSTVNRLAADFLEALSGLAAPGPEPDPEIEEILPLTPMQEGMLFHHLRGDGDDPYVGQIAIDLAGDVDVEALARAWRHAADAHPALRTEFAWESVERPVQRIRRGVTLPTAVHDAATIGIEEVMARARAGGFDVSRAPLARVDVLRSGDHAATAVFTHHHLLLDGWSLPIVLETVFEAYESIVAGKEAPRRTATPLRRYIEWIESRDAGETERFFRAYLAGVTATPSPDAGGTRGSGAGVAVEAAPAWASKTSGVVHASGPPGAAARARSLGLTANTVVQAAWALTLAACSGERDVVFGATSSGRPPEVEGIESLVGLCINTLPVRASVDLRATAHEWMREMQRAGATLRQYEHAPLALVQRCAPLPPNTPLFESLLVFENYPVDVAALGRRERFSVTSVRLHEETNYPLTIVASYEEGLRFRAIYRRSRYDEAGVRRILDRLRTAAEALLRHPDARLEEISVLAASERRLLLDVWNDTWRDYPREATVAEIFERVARERPDDVALLFDGGSMTYGEMLGRSAAVARALRERGIGPESRVALAIDRSPDLVVAILGVLRAGGAYVPVDPESPPARTARMLAGAGTSLLVAGGRTEITGAGFEIITLADLRPGAGGAAPNRLKGTGPEGLAYVMFTSGSTGEPKGIEVTNRNVLRLVLGADYATFGPGQTILQLAPVAFDASTLEIWGALLTGGRLAIAPPGPASAGEIARLLDRFDATTVWLTAGLFHVIVEEEAAALARVRQVIAGGDVLSPSHVRRLLDAGCGRVVNGYGPTETTTFACCDVLAPGDEVGDRAPIGRPVANARVYVLDEAMRPAPIGAPGELFIGGDGVARGYARRPALTAERFVPDPFGPEGSRLYRSGDVVRWRADGRIEFLGRRDGQVKMRGFRIEAGEIESALAATPGVRSAAVVARRDGESSELVAYVVPAGVAAGDGSLLREELASRLPRYMIPSRFIFLDALPLTANGKVDRSALPSCGPAADRARPARPLTPVEEAVAEIWRRVLGVGEVGADDDFFELGGHSLHATRLLAGVRRAFRVDLPMAALFEATTVAGLARSLVAHQPQPGHVDRAARALARLRAMTDDERARALEKNAGEVRTS